MTRIYTSGKLHQKHGHASKKLGHESSTKSTLNQGAGARRVYSIKCYANDEDKGGKREIKVAVTDTFDRLWYYMSERKLMYDKRLQGIPGPWTDDNVLRSRRFCNTFRLTDKTCQYLIQYVIRTGSQKPEELVFRVVLFDIFTRVSTWEYIIEKIGAPTWEGYEREVYQAVLGDAMDSRIKLYTGSFQKPAPVQHGFKANYMNHLVMLEDLMESGLPDQLVNATRISDVYRWIRKLPGFGDFNSWQLLQNLVYTGLLAQCCDFDTFVVLGCGAQAGLRRCISTTLDPSSRIAVVRWMKDTQRDHFRRLGLVPATLGTEKHELQLVDIEHALCEIEKYEREGSKKRLSLSTNHPSHFVLPINFSTTGEVVPEVYVVSEIVAHRMNDDVLELRVLWEGYPDSEATWEPAWMIKDDAPDVFQDYCDKAPEILQAYCDDHES